MTLKFREDRNFETMAKSIGVSWEVKTILLSEIDRAKSRANQARPWDVAVKKERAEDYARAQARGDVFPRIVVIPLKSGKYQIICGNHRDEAHVINKVKECECYVVTSMDEIKVETIKRSHNRYEGEGDQRRDAVANAIMMMEKYNLPAKEAARHYNVSQEAITKAKTIRAIASEVEIAGVQSAGIPETSLYAMSPVKGNRNVLAKVADLVGRAKVPAKDVPSLVKEIQVGKTEIEQLAKVEEMARKYMPSINGDRHRHQMPELSTLRRCLTTIVKLGEKKKTLASLGATGALLEEVRKECLAASKSLSTYAKKG